MRINMQKETNPNNFIRQQWDVAFVGTAIDDRGGSAISYAEDNSNKQVFMQYNATEFTLRVDDNEYQSEDLVSAFSAHKNNAVLLEATTLGFVEVYFACKALHSIGITSIAILYTEPLRYNVPRPVEVIHRRDFELTDETSGYRGIPGASYILDEKLKQKVIFFLGYEGQRLDQAFEQLPITGKNCSVVFGVPGFQTGWEVDAFANNARVMLDRELQDRIFYCGADNPRSVKELLEILYRHNKNSEQLFVAPIGTKPHGIGVALFACEHEDVGILYDHPKRSKGRSNAVGAWHLYDITRD